MYRHHQFRRFHIQDNNYFPTPTQITDSGEIVGFAFDPAGYVKGFWTAPHVAPQPIIATRSRLKPGTGTFVVGWENGGNFNVGTAVNDHNRAQAFIKSGFEGPETYLAWTPGQPRSFTELLGLNNSEVVVGRWYDAKHHQSHGLVGRPMH